MASAPVALDSIAVLGSQYGVKLWQLCGDQDAFFNFNVNSTTSYNTGSPIANPQAALTIFPGQGHWTSVWNTGYDPNWRANVHNKTIYEWMLQYKRSFPTSTLTVNAGANQSITLPINLVNLQGSATAPAGDTISSYLWTKISGPVGDVIVSPSAPSTVVSNLVQGTYSYQLKAISSASDTAVSTTQVTVNPVSPLNISPSGNAGADLIIQLPTDSVMLNGTANDADGTILSIHWTKIGGPSQFAIDSAGQAQTMVHNLAQGIYQFEFSVVDDDNAEVKDTVQVSVLAVALQINSVPVANAGSNTTIILPVDSVQLVGSGSTDSDGMITSYKWKKIAGPVQFTIVDSTQAQTMVDSLLAGVYQFELTVTDDSSAVAKDTLIVTVLTSGNQSPMVNAGNDITINLPMDSVTLSGTAADADGTIDSLHWTKISGPSSFFIIQPDSAQTVINNLVQGVYQFELKVMDNDSAYGKDTVTVIVNSPALSICSGTKKYMIPGGDNGKYINGDTASWWHMQVNPGDTLILKAQISWSYFRMENYNGTANCPIVVINEGGQVWMTSGLDATNCHHVKMTGSGSPNTYYGFKVYNPGNDGYGVAIGIGGKSKHIEVERVDVVNKGYGVWAKQDPLCDVSFNYPNYVMDDIEIHHCRFKRIFQDCIYAGNTDPLGERITYCNGVETHPVPMRLSNINIHHLIIDSCGRTGIQLSGADAGLNQIHDNVITNCGYEYNQWQGNAISIGGMTRNCYVYNNVIKNTFLYGIFDLGADSSFVYNNTIDSSGFLPIDPSIDINALAAATSTTALPGHILKNTMSLPGNIQATTKPTLPNNTKTVFYRNNKLGANATTVQANGIIQFGWWGPAQDWTSNNKVCNNTRLNGTTPAKIDPFWYTTLNQYWPVFDSTCTMPVPNMPPIANAGSDIVLSLPTDSVMLLGSGSDVDGTIISFHWEKISGPVQYTLVHADSAHTLLTDLVPGIYTFRLTVMDDDSTLATDEVQVSLDPPNSSPIANAGPNKVVTLPVNYTTLNGSGVDPDNDLLYYHWTKISGPACNISDTSQPVTNLTDLVVGSYLFELKVADTNGGFDRDTVSVIVNIAPTVYAGPDQTIQLPVNAVNLNATAVDADGTLASVQWTKISGPSSFTIVSSTQLQTNVNTLAAGIYQFEITVKDNFDATAKDTVIITVFPSSNTDPIASAGNDVTITLPVNSVSLIGSGADPNGTIISYVWNYVSGPSAYNISAPTQAQTTIGGLVAGVYEFELTVADNGGATAKDTVRVTVLPAPNVAPVANAGNDITLILPVNSTNLNGSGTDVDGAIVLYQWTKINGPVQHNLVNASQPQASVNNMIQGIYQFELKVTDDSGATARDTVVVIVSPVPNIPPVANAGSNQTIILPVNNVTVSGSGTDADGTITTYLWSYVSGPASYNITSPSQVQTAITGLLQGVYIFQFTITDNSGATATSNITITVNAAPPPPNVAPVANAGPNQTITLPVNNVTVNGSGTDADGTIATYMWSYVSGPASYNITNSSQAQTTIIGLVQGVYVFRLTVTDNDGATSTSDITITVNAVTPPQNVAPVANAGNDITITLPVNNVNLNGSGSDVDGIVVSYNWTMINGPQSFVIVSASQAQTVVSQLQQGIYKFELQVTDNNGATGKDTITVTVNAALPPVNMPPVANAGTDQVILFPANSMLLSGTGTDPDGVIVSYLWKKINLPASINIVNANSAQTMVTGLIHGNSYLLELTVTDDKGATGKDTMIVVVSAAPVNIPPVAHAGNNEIIYWPTDSVKLQGSGSDADGTVISYLWKKISGPSQYIIVSPNKPTTIFKDLVEGEYEFELTVTDNRGDTGKDTVKVVVVNYARLNTQTIIFPNPVTTEINVRIVATTQRSQSFIAIYDVRGAILYKEEFIRTDFFMDRKIDVSKLASGSYWVVIGVDINSTKTFPFMK